MWSVPGSARSSIWNRYGRKTSTPPRDACCTSPSTAGRPGCGTASGSSQTLSSIPRGWGSAANLMPWSSTATAEDGGPTRWNTKKALPMETVWRTASSSAGKPCVWKRCLPRPSPKGPCFTARLTGVRWCGSARSFGKKRSGPSRAGDAGKRPAALRTKKRRLFFLLACGLLHARFAACCFRLSGQTV